MTSSWTYSVLCDKALKNTSSSIYAIPAHILMGWIHKWKHRHLFINNQTMLLILAVLQVQLYPEPINVASEWHRWGIMSRQHTGNSTVFFNSLFGLTKIEENTKILIIFVKGTHRWRNHKTTISSIVQYPGKWYLVDWRLEGKQWGHAICLI